MAAYIVEKLCRGCQRCIRACPNEAIKMVAHLAVVDSHQCEECEECMEVCMQGAITFRTPDGNADTESMLKQELEQRLAQLQGELADLIARWPSHSVKPVMIIHREDLEEEILSLKEQLEKS